MSAAVVLLLQALQSWRSTLGPDAPPNRVPSNSQERSAFKTALNNLRRGEGVDGLTMEVCACYGFGCGGGGGRAGGQVSG